MSDTPSPLCPAKQIMFLFTRLYCNLLINTKLTRLLKINLLELVIYFLNVSDLIGTSLLPLTSLFLFTLAFTILQQSSGTLFLDTDAILESVLQSLIRDQPSSEH